MKTYRIKAEYIDNYSSDPEFCSDPVIDETELLRLAREWGMTAEEILEQVEEI